MAQKTWAKWEKVRDKFSPEGWRLLLVCLLAGFVLAFFAERLGRQKTVKLEEPPKVVAEREAPKASELPPPEPPEPPKVEEPVLSVPMWPLKGKIKRDLGWYRSQTGDWRYHGGIDITAPLGAQVRSALDGRIVEAGQDATLGQFLKIEHSGAITVYGHLSAVVGKVGDEVKRGQLVAYSGESGDSLGAALHFGVLQGKETVDPKGWLAAAQ